MNRVTEACRMCRGRREWSWWGRYAGNWLPPWVQHAPGHGLPLYSKSIVQSMEWPNGEAQAPWPDGTIVTFESFCVWEREWPTLQDEPLASGFIFRGPCPACIGEAA